jgi:hypothetical protein
MITNVNCSFFMLKCVIGFWFLLQVILLSILQILLVCKSVLKDFLFFCEKKIVKKTLVLPQY